MPSQFSQNSLIAFSLTHKKMPYLDCPRELCRRFDAPGGPCNNYLLLSAGGLMEALSNEEAVVNEAKEKGWVQLLSVIKV